MDPPSASTIDSTRYCLIPAAAQNQLEAAPLRHFGGRVYRVTHNSPSDSIVSTKDTSRQIRKPKAIGWVSGGRIVGCLIRHECGGRCPHAEIS
jgi:hypothetical protein